jgi:hypothetical protein
MASVPPDEERCSGIYGEKYRQRPELRGQRCEQRKLPGTDYCNQHFIPDGRRCTAHLSKNHPKSPGQRCPCWALKGQTICGFHGGHAPQNKAAAQRRLIEERARAIMQTYGRKIETTATEALLEEVKWTAGHVAWLRERVQEIETQATGDDTENPLVWGKVRSKTGGEDRGDTHEAGPNVWLRLYQTERAHLVKVCSEAIRAGIEERRVKLAESQGEQVAQAIRGILSDLRLSPEQLALVPDVVPKHLRALIS